MTNTIKDTDTAEAFATSWNNLPHGSIYSYDQFIDWLHPLTEIDITGKRILELGCGNASLLMLATMWAPEYLEGVDLGCSVVSANTNMNLTHFDNFKITKADLTTYKSPQPFDVVYCIGVLHHLEDPETGFKSVLANTKAQGCFHCWVYAKEGNNFVITFIDPLRKLLSKLPWWITKYLFATPLALIFFIYTQLVKLLATTSLANHLPMKDYALWISKRGYSFHRHVAFDQLVTPRTQYLDKATIENWLANDNRIDQTSTYVIMRNSNSWKFGGRLH
jgi:SAM-dependent methyltransferase